MPNVSRKRAQSLLKGNVVGMSIIFMMLMGILGYFIIVPAPYREGQLPELPITKYNNTLLDASPGKLELSEERIFTKKIDLLTAIADNTPKTLEQLISEQILIKKSLFQATYEDYDFSINTATFSAARLHFTVSEKTGDGVLTVRLNQHTIFSRQVGAGETLDILLPKYYLSEGMNALRVSVLGGSVLQTKSYLLTNVKLELDNYLNKVVEQSFSLTQNVARNIEEVELTAYVKSLGEPVNLELALNSEQIFKGVPSARFALDLPVNLLRSGSNTLSWSVDFNGKYTIQYGLVQIKELEVEEEAKRYYFSVSEKDIYFARQASKYTCELYLLKTSGADEIIITLNSETNQYAFENGEIKKDVCSALKEGTNKIVLSAEEDVVVSDLKLAIKNK